MFVFKSLKQVLTEQTLSLNQIEVLNQLEVFAKKQKTALK